MKTALITTWLLFLLAPQLTGQDGVDIRKYSLGFEGGLSQFLTIDRSYDGEQFSGTNTFLRPTAGIELRKRATRRMGWSIGVDFNWDKIVQNQFRQYFSVYWDGTSYFQDTIIRYDRTFERKSITIPLRVYFQLNDATALFGQFAYGWILENDPYSSRPPEKTSSLDLGMNLTLFELPKGDSLYTRFSCTVPTRWKVSGNRYWPLRLRLTVGYAFGR